MLRVITANLNGIRSATAKGFLKWLARQRADIVCVQELKAQAADMTAEMLAPHGYHGFFHYAEKKGYSGVGLYSKQKPDRVSEGIGVREFEARPDQYTWWSNRGQAWDKNVGWRIDYQIATPDIARCARKVKIYKDNRYSDHAPLTIDYDYAP